MTDLKAIENILSGNRNSFSFLMDKYHNELFKYIYNIVNNYETTEDVLQEVFLKLYNILHKYNSDKASFRTWMYRVTSNYVINYINSKEYRQNGTLEFKDYTTTSSEDIEKDIAKEEQINSILKVMSSILSKKHYKIMLLHYFSNLSVKEISESTEIPEKTIYKAIKTSIAKIKLEVE